jgi:hypothetical protein
MTAHNGRPVADGFRGGRAIGPWGSGARVILGVVFVGSVLHGHWARGWHPAAWLLGLVAFPAVVLFGQWWWARRRYPVPLRATGPIGHVVNLGVFLALYLTWWYAPALDVTSDAALLFYGASMLVAAVRGDAGCEVLAVSNWLLRRDDQIGCAPFWPLDAVEARRTTYPRTRVHDAR